MCMHILCMRFGGGCTQKQSSTRSSLVCATLRCEQRDGCFVYSTHDTGSIYYMLTHCSLHGRVFAEPRRTRYAACAVRPSLLLCYPLQQQPHNHRTRFHARAPQHMRGILQQSARLNVPRPRPVGVRAYISHALYRIYIYICSAFVMLPRVRQREYEMRFG